MVGINHHMKAAAHDQPDRPPVTAPSVRAPGAAASPSVRSRPLIRPRSIPGPMHGFSAGDHEIRRFWVKVVGAGAVEDLLRLITASRRGKRIKSPKFLTTLIKEGLAASDGKTVVVHRRIPPLGPAQRRRLQPSVRTEYDRFYARCDLSTTTPAAEKAVISPIANALETTTSTPPPANKKIEATATISPDTQADASLPVRAPATNT